MNVKNLNFPENLRRIRESKGLSKTELAQRIGVSDVQIGYWESGKNEPRMGKVQNLADVLNVTMDELIYDSYTVQHNDNLPEGAIPIKAKSLFVPFYGSIAAGVPLEMIPVDDYIEVPEEVGACYPEAFLLRVNGDSMNKVVPNGAYALIEPYNGEDPVNGDVVAIQVNGYEATLKRFFRLPNTIVLEPDSYNPEHIAQNFTIPEMDEIRIIGKLVWFMSPPNAKF